MRQFCLLCLAGWLLPAITAADQLRSIQQTSVDGQAVSVQSGSAAATIVCFLGTECPLARLYGPRLSDLSRRFAGQGVQLVGIISNRQDSVSDIRRYVEQQSISFPVIHDQDQQIADRYAATRTPEVFLLDDQLQVRYQGRIDDQYQPGIVRSEPQRRDLELAVQQLLDGQTIQVAQTEAVGCLIGRLPNSANGAVVQNDITYSQHVSRVLQRHCVECHRAGEIGPFAMDSYEEVAGWAETMLETIEDGRMPPWSADPAVGEFANARQMPEADKQILKDWVAGGLKAGHESQLPPSLPEAPQWQLAQTPDLVIPMRDRPYLVPGQGTVEYQYFVVDPGLEEDRWISGAQIIPGNRSVVHHAIAFIRPPDGVSMRGIGWLTAYVPGQRLVDLPDGYARRIPAGSKIVFQMHYTTNGRPQQDTTQVGLVFTDEAQVTHEVMTLIALNQEFEIPPHTSQHPVTASVNWFPEAGQLMSIAPHMHYRGRSFEVFAERDGVTQPLLKVPQYDFNWQHAYELADPLPLGDVDQLRFRATFDNSDQNPFNPDPGEWVTWGDQTWEEMAVMFLEVSEPRQMGSESESADTEPTAVAHSDPEREARIRRFVDEFFETLDANRDGIVQRSEMPVAVRQFSRWRWDRNGDEQTTRDEVRAVAEERF